MQEGLIEILKEKKVSDKLITKIIDSGYFLQHFRSWDNKSILNSVGDMNYGTKQSSSNFDLDNFILYTQGKYNFETFKGYNTYKVKSKDEILNDDRKKSLIKEGKMSFRGQVKEYYLDREIPNPFRQDKNRREISILPGEYRGQKYKIDNGGFNFLKPSAIQLLVNELEPDHNNDLTSQDIFRTEQHYATQTAGLDISFDIETALFFSNYKFSINNENKAFHTKIKKGKNKGVIYCFRFCNPSVKETEFLIKEFSLFKTYTPERVLRQKCGLPFFTYFERNISVCDIDCIIYLDEEFEYENLLEPSYMFPNRNDDKFYDKLIDLKHKYKNHNSLKNIVEYQE